jgi:hypothetical protein
MNVSDIPDESGEESDTNEGEEGTEPAEQTGAGQTETSGDSPPVSAPETPDPSEAVETEPEPVTETETASTDEPDESGETGAGTVGGALVVGLIGFLVILRRPELLNELLGGNGGDGDGPRVI